VAFLVLAGPQFLQGIKLSWLLVERLIGFYDKYEDLSMG
jgi:hypothetical protein